MAPSSEQLEHEAELNRAQLADTLDELRSRITPGQVMDQLVEYSRESGAGDFVRNLGRQVRDNPLPLTLMGASLAWLVLGNGRSSNGHGDRSGYGRVGGMAEGYAGVARDTASDYAGAARNAASDYAGSISDSASGYARSAGDSASDYARSASDTASDYARSAGDTASEYAGAAGDAARGFGESASATARDLREQASDYARGARDYTSETARNLSDATRSAAGSLSESASDAASYASDTARRLASTAGNMRDSASSNFGSAARALGSGATSVGRSTSQMGRSAVGAGRSFIDFCREQPVVLGAIGLAIGAALGAAFPSTETEDRLMGETSDDLKEQASDLASEQYDKAKSVVQAAAGEAKEEAERQDLFTPMQAEAEQRPQAFGESEAHGDSVGAQGEAEEPVAGAERAPGIAPIDEHAGANEPAAQNEIPETVKEHRYDQRP